MSKARVFEKRLAAHCWRQNIEVDGCESDPARQSFCAEDASCSWSHLLQKKQTWEWILMFLRKHILLL